VASARRSPSASRKTDFTSSLFARTAAKLDEVVSQIKSEGGSAESIAVDIANPKELDAAIEKIIDAHGRLDVLVNNAGITKDGLILRMEDADFDEVINTNLKSAFVAIRAAARPMMRLKGEVGGRIVNISFCRRRRGERGPGELRRLQGPG